MSDISVEHPVQKLCYLDEFDNLYFAAAGPHIYSLSKEKADKTVVLSTWPAENDDSLPEAENGLATSTDPVRPSKKRKVADGEAAGESSESSISVEIVAERAKGQRRKAKSVHSRLPNVSHLIAAKDRKHVIAITAEDKCIRVLELASVLETGYHRGRLKLLTQRCMPKRLCAIVLTPDDSTILVADKFGDVYSLPLHPRQHVPVWPQSPQDVPLESFSTADVQRKGTENFKPSASELTVHTKGNREALRQQREQKAAAKTKEGPTFEHKLLLGHMSLLTDLIMVEAAVAGKRRQYILTADRDEHIRVSRGPLQAHIIENYCLGHKEFVSKLCILPWQSEILVSGGGETSIKIFYWQTGRLAGDVSVFDVISDAVGSSTHDFSEHKPLRKLAVSGIWPMAAPMGTADYSGKGGFVLVTFEGLPFLLSLEMSSEPKLIFHQRVELPGNPLDILVLPEQQTILVSTDDVHKPGSVKHARTDSALLADSLHEIHLGGQKQQRMWSTPIARRAPKFRPAAAITDLVRQPNEKATYSVLGEFLYGLENLRKNRGDADADSNY